jgi:hypothetical protein
LLRVRHIVNNVKCFGVQVARRIQRMSTPSLTVGSKCSQRVTCTDSTEAVMLSAATLFPQKQEYSMKICYGPLILGALLAWMVGCDDMPPPPPAQPDTNEPTLPDSAVPPSGQPPGGQPPAEDQSSQFPGPGSYFEQPADQPPSNAESPPRFEFNSGDFPADANEGTEIPTNGGISEERSAGSLFENEAGSADAPGTANDADVNGEGDEAVRPEIGQP